MNINARIYYIFIAYTLILKVEHCHERDDWDQN